MIDPVYIVGAGKFLPGSAVANDEIEEYLGRIGGKPSRVKARVLRQNGIKTRHYALDREQRSTHLNHEMAARAVEDALRNGRVRPEDVGYLAVATTQGDLLVPGMASMVQGALEWPPCEIATYHGVCASGVMALKGAWLNLLAGESQLAVACASEFASRQFKASRYAGQDTLRGKGLPFDVEFLRFMLSDGAGAAVLARRPRDSGPSLRIEFIKIISHAGRFDTCMLAGAADGDAITAGSTWLDYPDGAEAARAGATNLRQDLKRLDLILKLGVEGFFDLIEQGAVDPAALDWLVCHYSSRFLKEEVVGLLERGGVRIPSERWFSNLERVGNVGSASLYLMLEELLREGSLRDGQKILCMVPESARFVTAYMLLTVHARGEQAPTPRVERAEPAVEEATKSGAPVIHTAGSPLEESLIRRLTTVWTGFEQRLARVPILRRLADGTFTPDDYRDLLFNLRQQVIDGSRWIARAASNITAEHFPLRSAFIDHTREEHRDFEMIERDYVSVGGALDAITGGSKNIGSEALSSYILHQASRENPFHLLGAMFIVEGLGNRMARAWGGAIRDLLGLRDEQVSFLLYHSQSDIIHFRRLDLIVQSGILDVAMVDSMVKTAKVTARLYVLQLEELGQF